MPTSIKEWIYLIAVGFMFLFPSLVWSASSEGLMLRKQAREKECVELLANDKLISLYAERGWTEAALHDAVDMADDMTDQEREPLKKKITEAFAYDSGPKAYFENAWHACVDGA